MNENDLANLESEVLVEKVREIERAKREAENSGEKTFDKNNTARILKENRQLTPPMPETEAKKNMSRRSRRSFLVGGVAGLAGIFGWRWMSDETKASLLRKTFEFNEKLSQVFYKPARLAPEFPRERVTGTRVNGGEGLLGDFNAADWRLSVGGLANRDDDLILTLDEIKALPRTEMTTELKCIEGWSIIVNWVGVRFSDFAAKYPPKTRSGSQPDVENKPDELVRYISLVTPDEGYYVGWDLPSILHPQTLLVYEMNGQPLKPEHGAPLRLASPTKYGIKQIKRIGRIEFTDERPKDYWAERGYDWYSGH